MLNKFYKFIIFIFIIKILICLSSPARIHSTNTKKFLRETWESIKNSVTITNNNIIEFIPDTNTSTTKNLNTKLNTNSYQKLIIETFYDLCESIKNITLTLLTTLSEFTTNTKENLTIATNKINIAISILAEKLLDKHNDTIKLLMLIIKQQLQQIEKLFTEVTQLTEHEFQRITRHINESLLIFSYEMESWSTELKLKLKSFNDNQDYEEGCKLIDKLITDSIQDMYECCNIAIRPWKSICKNIKDIFGNTLKIIINSIDEIDECIVKAKNTNNEFMSCINNVIIQVNELWNESIGLKERLKLGNDFPIQVIYSNGCIGVASYSIEVRKNDMEKKLEENFKKFNKNNLK